MVSYDALREAVIGGDEQGIEAKVRGVLNEGAAAQDILTNGLIGGMEVVGQRFRAGEMFLLKFSFRLRSCIKGLMF